MSNLSENSAVYRVRIDTDQLAMELESVISMWPYPNVELECIQQLHAELIKQKLLLIEEESDERK